MNKEHSSRIIFFRCMGLDEEEVSVIKEIFEHTPREWKYDLGRHTSVDGLNIEFVFHEKKIQFDSVSSKNLYRSCIKKLADQPISFQNLALSYSLSDKEAGKTFYRPRFSTLDNKLREFQFKMLYNIIFVNHHLYRFHFIANDKCSFCNKYEETYRHIFFECGKVRDLWEHSSKFFSLPILKELSWKEIHIGIEETAVNIQLLNHIILLIKYLIHQGRGKGKPPTPEEIGERLLLSKEEERKIAIERKTLTQHYKKWEHLKGFNTNQNNAKDGKGREEPGLPTDGFDRSMPL